ncbi:hypothetical protein JXA84_04480 [candidate division WOR-3 bacterium]|nr:hypothetical protein [candidate division WOR-3 bacterium]
MKIIDVVSKHTDIFLFKVVKNNSESPLDWEITAMTDKLIPNAEIQCIARVKMIDSHNNVSDCLVNISLPERIIDYVIYKSDRGFEYKEIYSLVDSEVIPAIASDAYGDYNIYYSKKNPGVGIDILKQGLKISENKTSAAEDLGYILRDEQRYTESLDAFLISEKYGVTSDFIYQEIRDLYLKLNDKEKADEYYKKERKNKSHLRWGRIA